MNLTDTLNIIATQLQTDGTILMSYASEDQLGGYHFNPSLRSFPAGSIWAVEGIILYALVRHLKPEKVVEVGGWAGSSASHLAAAVKANGKGHVYSIDDGSEFTDFEHGYLIPEHLRQYVTLVKDDGRVWLAKQEAQSIGLLFDDASHAASLIIELARLALQKVYPGGVLVNHDAMHDQAYGGNGEVWPSTLGLQVRDALVEAGLYFRTYLTEPSDCGLAVTVIPGVRNLDKHSEPKAVEESMNDKAEKAQFNQWDIKDYQGNANIESASEPPEPLATEDNPIVRAEEKVIPKSQTVTKKPAAKRGKGTRKPKVQ